MKKRLISIFIVCCLLCTMLPTVVFAAGNPYPTVQTYDDGASALPCTWVAWDEANKRLGLNLNNWHNGGDWAKNARNEGYLVDNNPAVNCIACWSQSGGWGHVAYVYDVVGTTIYIIEGGNKGSMNAQNATFSSTNLDRWASSGFSFEGFIHLQAQTPPTPSAQFTPWSSENHTYIRDTDASIGQVISVSGGTCTETGMYLYDANGQLLASASNPTYTQPQVYFKVNEECKTLLSPGTTYKYKFYAVVGGQTFYSDMGSFTTTGTPPQNVFQFDTETGTITSYYGSDAEVEIPSVISGVSVTRIGKNAFYGDGITSVAIPSTVLNIGEGAFTSCRKITTFQVADDNPNYCSQNGVLFNKNKTTLIQYPAGKTETSYDIPSSVTRIGFAAFSNCTSLTSISIPNGVISLADFVFNDCTSLTSISLPASVANIGTNEFARCYSLSEIQVAEDNPNFCSVDGVLFNKSKTTLLSCPIAGRTSYEIPDGVENIEMCAVCWCVNLTSVTIPDSVLNIGSFAFAYCSNLKNATFAGNAPSNFAEDAFDGCNEQFTIHAPKNNTTWTTGNAYNAQAQTWNGYPIVFDVEPQPQIIASGNCGENLTWTLDDNGLLAISGTGEMSEAGWLIYRDNITAVSFSNGVTSICDYAFSCDNLTNISMIPASVTTIGMGAFAWCGLSAISVDPENPAYVSVDGVLFNKAKTELLYYPEGRTRSSYAIPAGVTTIDEGAFAGCENLSSVTIPNSVNNISMRAFNMCKNLNEFEVDAANTAYLSDNGVLFSKDKTELIKYPLGNTRSNYEIPAGVTYIGESAFDGCNNLVSVTIPASVTSIGDYGLYECSNLTGIYFYGNAPEGSGKSLPYNDDLVLHCRSDKTGWTDTEAYDATTQTWNNRRIVFDVEPQIDIIASGYCGGDTTAEYDEASGSYKNLTWTLDSDGVLTISGTGEMADFFDTVLEAPWEAHKEEVSAVIVNNGVTSLGVNAFFGYMGITTVSLPNSLKKLSGSSLQNCNSITEISIPTGVTDISAHALSDCQSLERIIVAEENSKYSSVDGVLFDVKTLVTCPAGKTGSYTIPNGTEKIGDNAFSGCAALTKITIPDSVTEIGSMAFNYCRSLTEINLPSSISKISDRMIYQCFGLTNVVIPGSITSVGSYAFGKCTALMSVTFEGNAPSEFGNDVFGNTAEGFTIHAPQNNTTWTTGSVYDAREQTWHGYPIVFDVENTCEHAWNDGVVTTEPTHLAEGVKTFTCTKCGATRTETVDKLTAHTYDQQIADAKYLKSVATCTEAAVYYKSCLCGEAGTETFTYGDPAGHTYGTPSYAWDGANCTASRVCTKCSVGTSGHTQTETATGRYVKDTDATCTVCEKGHYEASFTNQAFVTQSTAKDSVDQGAPFGHSFPETWEKHNETQHKHTCTRCNTEVEYENHAWNDGVITTPATAAAEGVKTFTCTKCGETKTEPVAKLAEQNIWKSPDITWAYGEKTQITVNFTNLSENGGALSYASSNTDVATVTGGQTGCTVDIIGAGETTIAATAAEVAGKYAETSVSVKLTITPAPLTVTAKNLSISYGSEASGFDYTVSGLVLGENAADVLSGTPVYQHDYHQYDKAGNYQITLTGLNAQNYAITYQPGTLTVEKLADYTLSFVKNTLLQSVDHRTPVLATVTPQDSTAQILVEYYVGVSWTNTLPTTSGTYPVRASLTVSDNLVVPQTPIYIEDSIIIRDGAFIGNKDVMIDVTEKQDGSVEIGELTPEQIQAVTDDAAAKDKSVTLDLTGNGVASGAQGLTIPASLVDAMNDSSDVESFTVKAKDAEIEMDSSVLNTLAGSLEEGSKLIIQMETVNQNDLSTSQKEALESIGGGSDVVVLDLKLIAKQYDEHGTETGSNEIHQLGGVASVQVAYNFVETEGKILVALYVDNEGNTTYLPVTYKDGFVSFRTDHFSVYAVTEIEKADCGHSWDEGVVTLEPTTTSTGIRTYTCLICGETKTETIAKKPSGGNIGGGGGAAPAPAEGDKVNISATVSGTTATVQEIKDKELAKVSSGENVEIDLSGLKKNVDTATIPTKTVDKIAEQNGMSVKLSTGTVAFDTKAMKEISEQAGGSTVELAVESVKEVSLNAVQKEAVGKLDTALIIDIRLMSNGERLCSEAGGGFDGGKATITLPYEIKDNRTAENYNIYYVDDTGKLEKLNAKYDTELGAFVFEIEHLSYYVIAYEKSANIFADVNAGDYFYNAVLWAAEKNITNGTSDTTFSPTAPVTRAQVVTFLWRAAESPEPTGNASKFADVKAGSYYENAVAWAVEQGITKGTGETAFSPDAVCTRGQIVTFLARFAGVKDADTVSTFSDVKSTDYFAAAVKWAKNNKVTEGTSATTFSPNSDCTRAQTVTFLYRWMVK